jgi:hypothetical protein
MEDVLEVYHKPHDPVQHTEDVSGYRVRRYGPKVAPAG